MGATACFSKPPLLSHRQPQSQEGQVYSSGALYYSLVAQDTCQPGAGPGVRTPRALKGIVWTCPNAYDLSTQQACQGGTMWRKTTEAKPTQAASKPSGPASTTETPKQTDAVSKQGSTTPVAANATSTPAVNPSSANGGASVQSPATPATSSAPPAATKSAPAPVAPQARVPAPASQPPRSEEASTISAGLKIKGEITGTSDLTIDGETQGKVRLTNGRVTVGPSGRVIADIDAREIVVNGTVQGNLKATDSVRLGSSGQVEGSILTARIGIDDGARLRGNVEMIRAGHTQDSAPTQAARAATASTSQDSD